MANYKVCKVLLLQSWEGSYMDSQACSVSQYPGTNAVGSYCAQQQSGLEATHTCPESEMAQTT